MEEEILFIPEDEKAYDISDVTPLSQTRNWGLDAFQIDKVWLATKGKGIKVAVLDTGIAAHDDLNGAWNEAFNCTSDSNQWDEKSGHGTHCCGIVGARDNGFGVVGVAPECEIIPIKVLTNNGGGNWDSIAKGIQKAMEMKADIVSMSLGSSSAAPKHVEDLVIHAAENRGIIFVAAGGNNARAVNYPATYDQIIAVAAVDENGNYANFSSRGTQLDAIAPGIDVYSTFLNNSYAKMSGTSQACPFISGLCALILSHARNNSNIPQINNYKDMLRALSNINKMSANLDVTDVNGSKWCYGLSRDANINWDNL